MLRFCILVLTIFGFHSAPVARDASLFKVPGTIYSKQETTISAEQAGQIQVISEVGQYFKQGSVLAAIDTSFEKKQLALLIARRKNLKEKLSTQQLLIDNYRRLAANKVVSDETKAEKLIDVLDTKEQLNLLSQRINELEYVIEKKTVTAPFDGVVIKRDIALHETVSIDQKLLTIFDPKRLFAKANVPASMLHKLQLRDAKHGIDGQPGLLSVDYVLPKISALTSTVEVSFKVDSDEFVLGQNVSLQLKVME